MRKRPKQIIEIFAFLFLFWWQRPLCAGEPDFLRVLCYHDVPKKVSMDNFGVDQDVFVNTIEYLRTHGFHFVSLEDIRQAHQGGRELPANPVLLTFDDAYSSYADFVVPVLKEYGIPSVLSVVSSWIDSPPKDLKQKLMTWAQLKEVARSDLVEVATHSADLHQGVVYNPQGNEDGAVAGKFDVKTQSYEDDDAYRRRIKADVKESKKVLEDTLGVRIRAIAWPYGKYNAITVAVAHEEGVDVNLALGDAAPVVGEWPVLRRFLIYKNPELSYLLRYLKIKPDAPEQQRIMQVDLDLVYDPDPRQTEINLGRLLDRVKDMKVSAVYLQAFADPDGSGNIKSVYFPNRVLPMRADLFNRAVHQLRTRSMVEVYAWMPMLSIVLPDGQETDSLRVRSYVDGKVRLSQEPYQRLSPFSPEAREKLSQFYSDMAKNAAIDGVMFQDDGYLGEHEDFHPEAQKEYLKISGGKMKDPAELTPAEKQLWTHLKTEQLMKLTEQLEQAVCVYRPEAKFARNIYAEVLLTPAAEEWWAQNYSLALEKYDYVVIMAYPYLEEVKGSKTKWFEQLVRAAKRYPDGLKKTVFKIQTYDWRTRRWLDSRVLRKWLATLVAAGARHLGYYPDDYTVDQPRAHTIRRMMSTEDFPFKRKFTEQDWMYK